jgi:rhodanese-related sulfurtransferase
VNPDSSRRSQRTLFEGADAEPVPVWAQLRPRQPEDLYRDSELEGAQTFVRESDDAPVAPDGHGRNLSNIGILAYRRACLGSRIVPYGQEDAMRNPSIAGSAVTEIPAAKPEEAAAHFERLLAFETDCWDVHAAIEAGNVQFTILDVRAPEAYAKGHLPGAISVPHRRINDRNLAGFGLDTLFVVYCNGPHCNGADRGAVRLARLGRKVKKMIGGVEGWKDEGFDLVSE